jgi:hypothetical protein
MTRRQFAAGLAALGATSVVGAAGVCSDVPHYKQPTRIDFSSLPRGTATCAELPKLDIVERPLLSSWHDKPEKRDSLEGAYRQLAEVKDVTGLLYQARLHEYMCGHNDVHNTWAFLVWHRGFLYFHERILAKLTGQKNFRLPIWDWEKSPDIPQPWKKTRIGDNIVAGCPRASKLPFEIDQCRLQAWLFSNSFQEFVGKPSGPAQHAFYGVHNDVHTSLGGAMADPALAAADPLFYAHHANVDRYWWHWHRQLRYRLDKEFFDQKFYFHNEDGQIVCVCPEQLMDPGLLGYRYDDHPPDVSLEGLSSTPPTSGFQSSEAIWNLLNTSISWLSGDTLVKALTAVTNLSLALLSFSPLDLALVGLEPGRLRQVLTTSALVDLLKANAVPFPVRITAEVGPDDKIAAGNYYAVALRATGRDDAYFASFGIFSHAGLHPGQIIATGCLKPDALNLLLTASNVNVVYGVADASGRFSDTAAPFAGVTWDFLNLKAQFEQLPGLPA